MAKSDINAHNFGQNGSNSIKSTFLDDSYQTFLMTAYILFGLAEDQILPLF